MLLDNDAHVDGEGSVYIRTKGKLVESEAVQLTNKQEEIEKWQK